MRGTRSMSGPFEERNPFEEGDKVRVIDALIPLHSLIQGTHT